MSFPGFRFIDFINKLMDRDSFLSDTLFSWASEFKQNHRTRTRRPKNHIRALSHNDRGKGDLFVIVVNQKLPIISKLKKTLSGFRWHRSFLFFTSTNEVRVKISPSYFCKNSGFTTVEKWDQVI